MVSQVARVPGAGAGGGGDVGAVGAARSAAGCSGGGGRGAVQELLEAVPARGGGSGRGSWDRGGGGGGRDGRRVGEGVHHLLLLALARRVGHLRLHLLKRRERRNAPALLLWDGAGEVVDAGIGGNANGVWLDGHGEWSRREGLLACVAHSCKNRKKERVGKMIQNYGLEI